MSKVIVTLKNGRTVDVTKFNLSDNDVKTITGSFCENEICSKCVFNPSRIKPFDHDCIREKGFAFSEFLKIERVYDTAPSITKGLADVKLMTVYGLNSDEITDAIDFATKHGWKKKPKKVKKTFWFISTKTAKSMRYTSCLYDNREEADSRLLINKEDIDRQIHRIEIEVDE